MNTTSSTLRRPAILFLSLICLLMVDKAIAQLPPPQPSITFREDFSDQELQAFVKAHESIMEIQRAIEQKMIKAIEDEGLTVERFNEILEAQKDPVLHNGTSEQDMSAFNKAAQVIMDENQKAEEEMTTSIEDAGINVTTYQEIRMAYRQSQQVQDKVNKLINGDQ